MLLTLGERIVVGSLLGFALLLLPFAFLTLNGPSLIAPLLFGVCGMVALVAALVLGWLFQRTHLRALWLAQHGVRVTAEWVDTRVHPDIPQLSDQDRRWRLELHWHDPATHTLHHFFSDWLHFKPHKRFKQRHFSVLINPADPGHHRVELPD
ncbi:hypothetical protein ACTSKR_12885 [Chitinibacteraceae bacterium HSL-7]